jgi:hypothetical protein
MSDDLLSRRPRTKRVFSDADMARLRDLYYDPGVPLVDVADTFGVPVSTIMRWTAEMRWPRKSSGWRPAGAAASVAPPHRIAKSEPHPASVVEGDAAPHPSPLPAGGERGSTPLDPDRLAIEIAAHARSELAAMGESGGPMNASLPLVERKRRADHRLAVALDRPDRQVLRGAGRARGLEAARQETAGQALRLRECRHDRGAKARVCGAEDGIRKE